MKRGKYWAAIFLLAALLLLTACAVHYDESNIHRLYDADWITGKTRQEILDDPKLNELLKAFPGSKIVDIKEK